MYTTSSNPGASGRPTVLAGNEELQKVQLQTELEVTLVDLIIENTEHRGTGRSVSKRLSTKKLTVGLKICELYSCSKNYMYACTGMLIAAFIVLGRYSYCYKI